MTARRNALPEHMASAGEADMHHLLDAVFDQVFRNSFNASKLSLSPSTSVIEDIKTPAKRYLSVCHSQLHLNIFLTGCYTLGG